MEKLGKKLVFTPFAVALALVVLMLLHPLTGIGPTSNTFALCALAAIISGLGIGIIFLWLTQSIGIGLRLLIGALYLPAAIFSLLLAGF